MIKIKTKEEIVEKIRTDIRTDYGDGIATYENSSAYDIFINPSAELTADTDIKADFISRSRSLDELERVVRDARYQNRLAFALDYTFEQVQQYVSVTIDNLVSNWNEVRKPAQRSRGIIRIYFTNADPVTLASNLIFETRQGIQFRTTNSFNSFTPAYDSIEGLYFVESSIEAVIAGQAANVEAGTIIIMSSNISGVQKIVNRERTQFGQERETDLQLIDRVRQSWKSRNTSVIGGFIRKIINYPGVIDLSVVLPSDSDQVRNEKNAVDVYILAQSRPQIKEDIFNSVSAKYAWERLDDELNFEIYPVPFNTDDSTSFKFLSQPILNVTSISYSNLPDGSYIQLNSSEYEVVKDVTSTFAQSIRGHDRVEVQNTAFDEGSWIKIIYMYDILFRDLQALFLNYNTSVIGANILFKRAVEKNIDIEIILKLFVGYNQTAVQDKIISDLNIFFAGGIDSNGIERIGYKLGQKIDKSDVLAIILAVEGVDFVDLDTYKLRIDGEEFGQTTTPKLNEYFRLGNVTFSVKQSGTVTPITNVSQSSGGVET